MFVMFSYFKMAAVMMLKQTIGIPDVKKTIILPGFSFLKRDLVFTSAFTLALVSSAYQVPKLEYMNVRVLISLFNLMLAVKAFEQLKLLDKVAAAILTHCSSSRTVSAILVSLAFISSMFVTNDVALITFVPLTLIIGKRAEIAKAKTVILQTIAANIGSSLTPMGNPQNLFIFSYFHLSPLEFFSAMGMFVMIGMGFLAVFVIRLENRELTIELPKLPLENNKKAIIWGIVFALIVVSILGGISYKWAFIAVMLTVLISDRSLLLKIDYSLLLTFICFFIFIGNAANLKAVHAFAGHVLHNYGSVNFSSIIASQVISNVPASILLAKFTAHWQPLLLGVNIGGLGTLIGSLASLISYKLFSSHNPHESRRYLAKFSLYNIGFLIVLALIQYGLFEAAW